MRDTGAPLEEVLTLTLTLTPSPNPNPNPNPNRNPNQVRPSGGPPSGGTLVNLSGTFFRDYGGGVQGPRCRFGSVVVPATLLSFTQAQCLSPPHPAGDAERVPVSLSLNGYTDERGLAGGPLG